MDQRVDSRADLILYHRQPENYRHWKLDVQGRVATLAMKVDEEGGLKPGYRLKLNSYDLGVDMELADAVQRLRFEHPEVGCVIVTSGTDRIFCSGANIYMLGLSTHAWKVNFCKFTNETRNGFEDSSDHGGLKFIAAVNGACAGGGYEMALACDEIVLVDDRSSGVSLPEIPLLAVLPGTGGLTRVVDKRKVRRDYADMFCTVEEGVRGKRAKEQGFVDEIVAPGKFKDYVQSRAQVLAGQTRRPEKATGVKLTPLNLDVGPNSYRYGYVSAEIDRERRFATITVKAPETAPPSSAEEIRAQGAAFWPLAMARELDDLILNLRTNDAEIGLWVMETEGDPAKVLAYDAVLDANASDWFVSEVTGMLRRTFARLEVSSRSIYAIVKPDSCFAGTLAELMLAADRIYMLDLLSDPAKGPSMVLSSRNFGATPTINGDTRLGVRFLANPDHIEVLKKRVGERLITSEAVKLGLVTVAPDDLDWEEEIRLAIGDGSAKYEGGNGALKLFGTGKRPNFDWNRV